MTQMSAVRRKTEEKLWSNRPHIHVIAKHAVYKQKYIDDIKKATQRKQGYELCVFDIHNVSSYVSYFKQTEHELIGASYWLLREIYHCDDSASGQVQIDFSDTDSDSDHDESVSLKAMNEFDIVGVGSVALIFAKCSLLRAHLDDGKDMRLFVNDILRYRFIYPNTYRYYVTHGRGHSDLDACERDFLFHVYENILELHLLKRKALQQ